ncbi:MAG: DUF3794 domain-containing protein [Oscillospiraceae bacterium]|nr:DUF3794 domain-containing protein [Oscillospiraceae bacterium]
MEVMLNRTTLDCFRNVFTQTVFKEDAQESVVPDTLPDIGEILSTTGLALIRGKDVGEGRIRVEGNIPVRVLYRGESGEDVFSLEVTVPLYASFESPSIPAEGCCVADIRVSSLSTRVLNPRKISVRAEASVTVRCWASDSLEYFSAPGEDTGEVQLLERGAVVSPVTAVTEKTFVLTDEFSLPGSGAATEVLDRHTAVQAEEVRAAGDKLIVRGSVRSGLLLRMEDGSLTGTEFSTQFSQVIEAEGMGKDSFPQVVLLFSGVYYELNGDGRGGSMELHLVLQAAVRSRTEVRYIADAYSNAFSLERETERLEQPCVLSELTLSTSLREQLDPGFAPGEVVLSELTPGQAQIDGDTVSVPLTALLYCLDGEGRVLAAERTVQARFRYELAAGQRLEPCEIALREAQASPGQDGVELRVQTEVRVFVTGDMQTDCIRALRYDESVSADLSDEPSLTLLRASSGDSLWEIAKRCHSTVDLIREVNGLEDLPQPWEKLIAIPIAR